MTQKSHFSPFFMTGPGEKMLAFHLKQSYQSGDTRQFLQLLDEATPNDAETDNILAAYAQTGKDLKIS
jgi:hypothetical protein